MPQRGSNTETTLAGITDSRAREMYELYVEGATLKEVGARFDLTAERVRQIFRSAGLPSRSTSGTIAMQRDHLKQHRREEICAAFSEYKDIDQVARRLRVPQRVVKEVVESHFPKTEYSRRKVILRRYADDELIASLQEASVSVQGVLTIAAYTDYAEARRTSDGRLWPTHQTYSKRFGSWREALQAAGLKANPPGPMTGHRQFDEAHCVDAVRVAARELGKVPTATEYDAFAKASGGALPSQATVRHRCGTWYKALAKGGM